MKKVVRLTEGQFIDLVKKVISESVVVEQEGTPTPSWVKSADPNVNMNAKAKMGYGPTQATYFASTTNGDTGIIIPKGSKFVPAGSILLSKGYLVNKQSLINNGLTYETLYTNSQGLANALKSGKLSARAVNIGITNSGTVIYEGGNNALGLFGNGQNLSKQSMGSFA